jgi:hypothetical protein
MSPISLEYQFLASFVVGRRNIEVAYHIGLNVAWLLHVAYAKDMHPLQGALNTRLGLLTMLI